MRALSLETITEAVDRASKISQQQLADRSLSKKGLAQAVFEWPTHRYGELLRSVVILLRRRWFQNWLLIYFLTALMIAGGSRLTQIFVVLGVLLVL